MSSLTLPYRFLQSRVDLLALLTTSIETSLPKDGSTRDAQSFSHRANRNSNASGTRYATGDGSANNRRKPGRKKDPEGKTRVVTCDLAAVMHGTLPLNPSLSLSSLPLRLGPSLDPVHRPPPIAPADTDTSQDSRSSPLLLPP